MDNTESSASSANATHDASGNPSVPNVELTSLHRLDGPELFALTHANRDHLRVWLPWVDHIFLPGHTQAFVDASIAQVEAGKQMHFMLRLQGAIIGTIGLIDIGDGQATVGYWIAQAHQGKGYVTQGVLQIKAMAFDQMGLDCLHLNTCWAIRPAPAWRPSAGLTWIA